jgi:proteasome lid subunit RPN8/RPN11
VTAQPALHVTGAVKRAMIAHAVRVAPLECCGFLVGRDTDVLCAVEMDNIEGSPTRFRMDDVAHIELRRVLRRATPALAILGIYHSHPQGEAYPSETDVAQAFYPDWVHVIVGLGGRQPVVRGFRIVDTEVRPVILR